MIGEVVADCKLLCDSERVVPTHHQPETTRNGATGSAVNQVGTPSSSAVDRIENENVDPPSLPTRTAEPSNTNASPSTRLNTTQNIDNGDDGVDDDVPDSAQDS